MDAADLVLTRDRGCVTEASNHWGRNLKGHIDIQNGAVTVALEVAQYDRKTSALTGHTPFEGNGAYRMSDLLKEEFQPRNEQEAESIKWHSCKYRMLPSGSKY